MLQNNELQTWTKLNQVSKKTPCTKFLTTFRLNFPKSTRSKQQKKKISQETSPTTSARKKTFFIDSAKIKQQDSAV